MIFEFEDTINPCILEDLRIGDLFRIPCDYDNLWVKGIPIKQTTFEPRQYYKIYAVNKNFTAKESAFSTVIPVRLNYSGERE